MSDSSPQFGISKEELLSIRKALVESCESFSQKEKDNTLTWAEYNQWQACLKEHKNIEVELAEIRESDRCLRDDLKPWTRVDTTEKTDGDWVIIDRK